MFQGSLIFASFALKKDIRLKRTHIFRFVCIGLVFIILFSSWLTSSKISSPGLDFFTKIVWLNFWLITLAGIGFFSTAITEEKEEETLPLLKLAGIDSLGLLLGKSTVRSLRIILILISQLPFLMLAIALGGITPLQIGATIVAMIAYVILIANFSLLCSVYSRRSGEAIILVLIGLFILFLAPTILTKISVNLQARGYLAADELIPQFIKAYQQFAHEISVTERIKTILSTGYSGSVFNTQVVGNSLLGLICFITAWFFFERFTMTNHVKKERKMSQNGEQIQRKSRPGKLAFLWKEFHFVTGGKRVLIIKSILYISVILFVVGGGLFLDQHSKMSFLFSFSWNELIHTSLLLMLVGLVAECTIYTSRLFREERKLKMLPLITILPHSFIRIVYEKIFGCMSALIPVGMAIGFLILIAPDSFTNFFNSGINSLLLLFGIQFILFLHLLAFYSLIVRWGALAFAIGTMILVESVATPFLQILFVLFHVAIGEAGIILPVFYLSLISCFILQLLIAKRLRQIAAEE
ncbi:ABC transporter permease [Gimesia fumaroli]|uniref:ABC-2 family transporter protein n=1 Tax=Gimesia fumaroli TaxID=2527976 RepID=A0A518IL77_9PLAN|nr:ABC transporter permease [Gimesia fumaroli]QDV53850.1 ABC-2 family transporter protein [Gimesia fumaroli]